MKPFVIMWLGDEYLLGFSVLLVLVINYYQKMMRNSYGAFKEAAGIYFEDVPFTTECYLKAEKCIKSSSIFYIYRQRQNSIVSSININKLKDLNYIIEHLWNIMNKSVLVKEEQKKLNDIIFATFSIEMWYLSHHSELTDSRKEVVEDLKMRVPNLLFMNGVKQMLVSILFKISPWLYLRLYSFV